MKSYLRLLLISVFFIFVLNVAQAEVSEGITQEEIPEEILEAHEAVWKFEISRESKGFKKLFFQAIFFNIINNGTAFFIGPNQVVTNFHVISDGKNESYKSRSIENIYLKQGDKKINFKKVLYASAVDDLVILETEEEVSEYLNVSEEDPSGRLFALGYPGGVKQTLIHLEEYGVSDKVYDYEIAVNKSDLPGLSGGPVLDEKKELIGVAYRASGNMLRFIKVSKIEELRRGSIGIDCSEFSLSFCVEEAIQNLEEKAEQGDILAQYQLALMYLYGIGMEQDYKKAFYWMEKAENQGDILDQGELAMMYFFGIGVEKNVEKAFYLLSKVARQGYASAIDVMLKEAEEGYASAQYQLALMYLEGKGVDQDEEQAFYWMSKAARQGYASAFDWMLKKAEEGYASAQYELALMYLEGKGVDQDDEQAFYWMEKAARQGDAPAQYELVLMYFYGIGVDQDEEQAFYWMSKAAR